MLNVRMVLIGSNRERERERERERSPKKDLDRTKVIFPLKRMHSLETLHHLVHQNQVEIVVIKWPTS